MATAELLTRGLVTAVTTPFSAGLHVDEGALREHLQCLWLNGCHHILVSGTTGEFFSLCASERETVMKTARDAFQGTIMFHAGADCLGDTLRLVRAGIDAGADSIASLPPWYLTGVEEEGVIRYFEAVAACCTVPFLIYNFPKHTRSDLSAHLLARVPHWGIKDSSGRLELIEQTPRYFIGSDKAMLRSHRSGGAGFISARSNCEPTLYARIDEAMQRGDNALADQLHIEILKVTDVFSGMGQISLVKQGISRLLPGYPTFVRLPLLDHPGTAPQKEALR